jgi:hypothetical protein
MNELLKSKTVWTGIAGLVAAIGGYFTGELDIGVAIQTGIACLLGIFLRAGIAKQGSQDKSAAPVNDGNGSGFAAVSLLMFTGALTGFILATSGCAGLPGPSETPQSIVAKSLLVSRQGIIAAAETADTLCAQGIMKQEDCNQARNIYEKAQAAYTAASDAFLLSLTTHDAQDYEAKRARLKIFSADLNILLKKYSASAGGAQ